MIMAPTPQVRLNFPNRVGLALLNRGAVHPPATAPRIHATLLDPDRIVSAFAKGSDRRPYQAIMRFHRVVTANNFDGTIDKNALQSTLLACCQSDGEIADFELRTANIFAPYLHEVAALFARRVVEQPLEALEEMVDGVSTRAVSGGGTIFDVAPLRAAPRKPQPVTLLDHAVKSAKDLANMGELTLAIAARRSTSDDKVN